MFSRRAERPREEPRFAPTAAAGRSSELVPVPVTEPRPGVVSSLGSSYPQALEGEETVFAADAQVEGRLRSAQGVRVIGSFAGSIESETYVRVAEGAVVRADVTADEIVVAGRCEGLLVAHGRLEVLPSGRISGEASAPRIALHEGGIVDAVVRMTPAPAARTPGRATVRGAGRSLRGAGGADPAAEGTGDRDTVEGHP